MTTQMLEAIDWDVMSEQVDQLLGSLDPGCLDVEPVRMPEISPPNTEYSMPVVEGESLARDQIPDYQAIPVECFPQPIQQFILAQAATRNCDPAAVAVPVLAVLASAVGDWRIQIKHEWTEPAILWTALIANGQECHDGLLHALTKPLQNRQSAAYRQQQQLLPEYEQHLVQYRAAVRRTKDDQLPPVRPVPPIAERTIAADWTVPSLARLLMTQQRGLLVCPRELDGWLGRSLGKGCRAALDRQVWFDLHDGRSVTIETRSSRPPIQVDRAAVSLTGALSEELLVEKLTKASGPCGLASRLLFASPPSRPLRWTDADVSPAVTAGYGAVLDRMFELSDIDLTSDGSGAVLSPAARMCLIEFVEDLSVAQRGVDDVLFAWSTKLAGQAARLALVLHLARWGAGEPVDLRVCDLVSMERGIALARWFAYEAQRVVTCLSLKAQLHDELEVMEWLRRRGGPATPRDLCRSNSRKYPTMESAIKVFEGLVGAGLTNWVPQQAGPRGGRPTRKMAAVEEPDFVRRGSPDPAGTADRRSPLHPVAERHHDTEPTQETWAEQSCEQSRQGHEVVSGAVAFRRGRETRAEQVSCAERGPGGREVVSDAVAPVMDNDSSEARSPQMSESVGEELAVTCR